MKNGSIDNIESFGLVDGPGIRTVVFFNGCKLRCKFCHNPEMWKIGKFNYSKEELVKRILRNKPYFKNRGGVTFSGGEPLIQYDFLIDVCKELKKEGIHIAIDTAGVGNGDYKEIFNLIDLVILDIKHVDKDCYKDLTGQEIDYVNNFIKDLNNSGKEVWIRQVIVPDLTDNSEYIDKFNSYLNNIKNITKVIFLPYHKLGDDKYKSLGIDNPYLDKKEMDKEKCKELYNYFLSICNLDLKGEK